MPHRPEPPSANHPPPHTSQHPMIPVASPGAHRHHMHPLEAAGHAGYNPHLLHSRVQYPYGSPPAARMGYHMHPMWHHPPEMRYHMEQYAVQQHHHRHATHVAQSAHYAMDHPVRRQQRDNPECSPQQATRPHSETPTPSQSEEEVAASALMMAASASISSESTNPTTFASRPPESVPFKKRKKHLDFMRRNGGEIAITPSQLSSVTPCQISPVSNTSYNDQQQGDELSTSIVQTSSSCQMDSYDAKDGQALTDSAKIGDPANISATSPQIDMYSVIANFPFKLHSAMTHGVLQWLPRGHAWKIVRWDGLQREILPRYFPQLCSNDEEGKGSGSIDGFLWHIRAWGFSEIRDGPDVGAYSHEHFVRDDPKLCKYMKFSLESESPVSSHELETPPQVQHSLLRVPSLATSRSDRESKESSSSGVLQTQSPDQRPSWTHYPKADDETTAYYGAGHKPNYARGSPSMWRPYMGYHPEDAHNLMRHYPPPASPTIMHNMVACPPSYDTRYPFRPHPDNMMRPPPHSPQIARVGSSRQAQDQGGSFPVSMRGKGSRGFRPVPVRAPPAQPTFSNDPVSTSAESLTEDEDTQQTVTAQLAKISGTKRQISNSEGSQIAMAISRKTKMKLPVSRSKSTSSEQAT